jgi:hypothetical protein
MRPVRNYSAVVPGTASPCRSAKCPHRNAFLFPGLPQARERYLFVGGLSLPVLLSAGYTQRYTADNEVISCALCRHRHKVHGLRDLKGLYQFDPDGQLWAQFMADLLIWANRQATAARAAGRPCLREDQLAEINAWCRPQPARPLDRGGGGCGRGPGSVRRPAAHPRAGPGPRAPRHPGPGHPREPRLLEREDGRGGS